MSSSRTPSEHDPSEHTPSEHSYSADPSGYVTSRPRRNPPAVAERDPYDDDEEVSSGVPTSLPVPVIPPRARGPRVITTARKSVPIPRRVTLTVPRTTEGETSRRWEHGENSRVATGYPVRQTQGMTPGEGRWIRHLESELHSHRSRLDHQHHILGNLTDVLDSHNQQLSRARETAIATRRIARMLYLCFLMMAIMFALMGLMFWKMMH